MSNHRAFHAVVACFSLFSIAHADLYVAEDVSGFGNSWTFDGGTFSIQNAFSGVVDSSNLATVFESWSLDFTTQNGVSYSLSSATDSLTYQDGNSPNLRIEGGQIFFPASSNSEIDSLRFFNSGGTVELLFTSATISGVPLLQLESPDEGISNAAYGSQGGVGLIATAVPEPSALLLVSAVGLCSAMLRRRWARPRRHAA